MSVKISAFEIENVKRVKAVAYEPTENGLTVLGGKNGQGKSKVTDKCVKQSLSAFVACGVNYFKTAVLTATLHNNAV